MSIKVYTEDIKRLDPNVRNMRLTSIINTIYTEAKSAVYYAEKMVELLQCDPKHVDAYAVRVCLECASECGIEIKRKAFNAGRFLHGAYGTEPITSQSRNYKRMKLQQQTEKR